MLRCEQQPAPLQQASGEQRTPPTARVADPPPPSRKVMRPLSATQGLLLHPTAVAPHSLLLPIIQEGLGVAERPRTLHPTVSGSNSSIIIYRLKGAFTGKLSKLGGGAALHRPSQGPGSPLLIFILSLPGPSLAEEALGPTTHKSGSTLKRYPGPQHGDTDDHLGGLSPGFTRDPECWRPVSSSECTALPLTTGTRALWIFPKTWGSGEKIMSRGYLCQPVSTALGGKAFRYLDTAVF